MTNHFDFHEKVKLHAVEEQLNFSFILQKKRHVSTDENGNIERSYLRNIRRYLIFLCVVFRRLAGKLLCRKHKVEQCSMSKYIQHGCYGNRLI